MKKEQTILVRITKETSAKLEKVMYKLKVHSKSAVCRKALEEYISKILSSSGS